MVMVEEPTMIQLSYDQCKPVLVSNDTEVSVERWDDPGVYPSGAGGGPLRSYNYLAIGGSYTVVFTDEQLSTLAVEFSLVDEFRPMSADEVVKLAGTDVDWYEAISEFYSSKVILSEGWIVKAEVNYHGNGKFIVEIVEAEY